MLLKLLLIISFLILQNKFFFIDAAYVMLNEKNDFGDDLEEWQETIMSGEQPMSVSEYKKSTEDDHKTLKTLKMLLESLRNRGSTFKSVPYSPDVVDKYVNGYLKQIDELSKKMKPSSELQQQQMKRTLEANKKAVCGSLNGNPSYRWICW